MIFQGSFLNFGSDRHLTFSFGQSGVPDSARFYPRTHAPNTQLPYLSPCDVSWNVDFSISSYLFLILFVLLGFRGPYKRDIRFVKNIYEQKITSTCFIRKSLWIWNSLRKKVKQDTFNQLSPLFSWQNPKRTRKILVKFKLPGYAHASYLSTGRGGLKVVLQGPMSPQPLFSVSSEPNKSANVGRRTGSMWVVCLSLAFIIEKFLLDSLELPNIASYTPDDDSSARRSISRAGLWCKSFTPSMSWQHAG